jgi:hypothetical protein
MKPDDKPLRHHQIRAFLTGALAMLAVTLIARAGITQAERGQILEVSLAQTQTLPVTVDWNVGMIVATGRGIARDTTLSDAQAILNARGAAIADAQRLLAQAIGDLPLTSSLTLAQCSGQQPNIERRVNALLKGAAPVQDSERVEKQADGSKLVFVNLEMPLNAKDGLREALRSGFGSACRAEATHTGLVIDAVNLEFRPCLAPRLSGPDGSTVWDGTEALLANPEIPGAAAAYSKNLETAMGFKDRVGANPLVVKATAVRGAGKCELVFSAIELAKLNAAHLEAPLAEARVAVVF